MVLSGKCISGLAAAVVLVATASVAYASKSDRYGDPLPQGAVARLNHRARFYDT